MGTLLLGFVTSSAPECIERLEEVLDEFVSPLAQDWIWDLRRSAQYAEARQEKIAELTPRLPVAVVQTLEARLAKYDKTASHELRAQVETLPPTIQADYAALVTLLAATKPSCIPSSFQRTLYRAAWEESGLARNPLRLKTSCPNCSKKEADMYLVEGRFDWELSCPDCGYEDRAAKGMPEVSFDSEPSVPDQAWSSWACSTSAMFGDWPVSVSRRNHFLERLKDFTATLDEQLATELATIAHDIEHVPVYERTYSFSANATAVSVARVKGVRGEYEAVRVHDQEADRLALSHRTQCSFSLVRELEPYRHWKGRFRSRINDLKKAVDNNDALEASVSAGQLLLDSRWFGFIVPIQMTLELKEDESLELADLATHPRLLAAFLDERLRKQPRGKATAAQLEEWIRDYIGKSPVNDKS